ncbi:MAG TPA: orotidine 5'-phosphate decarboxylase / HUMPS family protein [Candidatus Bathyarchaeia archaeon]|nr:orotidine 5'-phosphate decarboxylase / HUMPS family protein [Candidatus Bathyarchaeia archaeon]
MLSKKKKYLQIALNSTLDQAQRIINQLPVNDRILIEAGTPLLKAYGETGIRRIKNWWEQKLWGTNLSPTPTKNLNQIIQLLKGNEINLLGTKPENRLFPYIIADYKAMDRGATEVGIAARAGANAITVLGQAPVETIDLLIKACLEEKIDSIVDMMNVNQPYKVLRRLKKLPTVVMLHRGVDETDRGNKPVPIHQINKIKGTFDVLVAIGGGDTLREVQSAVFNGAEIVMVWKEFYELQDTTAQLATEFLQEVK